MNNQALSPTEKKIDSRREYKRKWRRANADKNREYHRKWRTLHPEIYLERKRSHRASNPGRNRKYTRAAWAPGEHERAEAALPFVQQCACCGSGYPYGKLGWLADHDHVTGKFRGHVCFPCNVILGFIESYGIQDDGIFTRYLEASKCAAAK